jgi:GNAT superfamily N-acetyltransferase
MDLTSFKFSPLLQTDDLSSFDCGLPFITDFLKEDAKFYQQESLANTYIFWDADNTIGAYFSISNDCLSKNTSKLFSNAVWNRLHRNIELPNPKRIRHYPAVLVGRLGVHNKYHGKGTAYQLMDFIKEYAVEDCKPACRLLLLDAVNQPRQIKYYMRNDFSFLFNEDSNEETRSMYFNLDRLRLN